MGLDTVELVIDLEKEFDLEISDSDAAAVGTVGEIARLIARKLSEKEACLIDYQVPLPKIIDILVGNYGIPRQVINTTSHVVHDLGLE